MRRAGVWPTGRAGYRIASFTLLMVPVIYAIAVLDLRIVKWPGGSHEPKQELPDALPVTA